MDEIGKPVICPNCSKIACMICFQKWVNSKGECPHCRSLLTFTQLVKLDWATDVLEIWKKTTNPLENKCLNHCLAKDYWCNDCLILGCSDCFLLESNHSQHEFWKARQLWSNQCNEIYKAKHVSYYHEQLNYWNRYLDDKTRQLSGFNLDCQTYKNDGEELFLAARQSFQSIEDDTNSYYEKCLKVAEEKISIFTQALESGETFLNGLPLETALQGKDGYFSEAASIVKSVVDDYGNKSLNLHEVDCPRPSPLKGIIPEYESCKFTIPDFKNFVSNGDTKMSPATRFSGFNWRIKAYTFQSEKSGAIYFSIFLELVQGSPGEFEYKIELLETHDEFNTSPSLSKVYKSKFRQGECWGYQKFVKLGEHFNSLYYDPTNDSITLIYHVRPTTFHQKCTQLQEYILKLEENEKTHLKNSFVDFGRLKTLHEIPLESRESLETLEEIPLDSPHINHQLQEIERIVENTSLQDTFQDDESCYSSTSCNTSLAETILTRIQSTKNK